MFSQTNEEAMPHSTNSKGEEYSVMDEEAMIAYREDRHEQLVESLALSNLSSAHQELFANALAAVFVGIPVSSYSQSTHGQMFSDEIPEERESWQVSAAGQIEGKDNPTVRRLTGDSPFRFFPPTPFLPETAKLIKDSEREATVVFELDLDESDSNGASFVSKYPGEFIWMFEFTANKKDQSPKRIEIKLKQPVRERFRYKITTVSTELLYSFVESCGCFAVSKSKAQINGSSKRMGQIRMSMETRFSDIACEKPYRYLLPTKAPNNLPF